MPSDDPYARLFELIGQTYEEIERFKDDRPSTLVDELGDLSTALSTAGNKIAQLRPELVGQEQIEVPT